MIKESLLLVINNIRMRKLRSILTTLGISIGIFLVVVLLSLSQGMKDAVSKQFAVLGPDVMIVEPGAGSLQGPANLFGTSEKLRDKDIDEVKSVNGVEEAIGFIFRVGRVKFTDTEESVVVHGIEEKSSIIKDMYTLEKGSLPKRKTDAVIGKILSEKKKSPFKKAMEIGDKVSISGKEFKVAGILKSFGNSADDTSFSIPLDEHKKLFNTGDDYQYIWFRVSKGYDLDLVRERVISSLRSERGVKKGEEDFTISTAEDILNAFLSILDIIQIAVLGFSVISIFVGLIGIMNTMFTNISERTREIGVMKAIGARNRQILTIFLIESGIYGLIGGIIGVFSGLVFAKIVEQIIQKGMGITLLEAHISYALIFGSLGFSFVVGILSGILPSYNASMQKPVESLRYE